MRRTGIGNYKLIQNYTQRGAHVLVEFHNCLLYFAVKCSLFLRVSLENLKNSKKICFEITQSFCERKTPEMASTFITIFKRFCQIACLARPCTYVPYVSLTHALPTCAPTHLYSINKRLTHLCLSCYKHRCVCRHPWKKKLI